MIKRIVCLANSRKWSERCIAGIEISGPRLGTWVRPVSIGEHTQLSKKERMLSNGQEPRLLDIIDVSVTSPDAHTYQRENWRLDPRRRWTFVKRLAWNELDLIADKTGVLWPNGYHTRNGRNDHVPRKGRKSEKRLCIPPCSRGRSRPLFPASPSLVAPSCKAVGDGSSDNIFFKFIHFVERERPSH